MTVIEQMKRAAKHLNHGDISISEAEEMNDNIIVEETVNMFNGELDSLDSYVEKVRYLKRKKYYLLLDATRRTK